MYITPFRQKRRFQQELSRLESQQQAVLSAEFKKREQSRERAYRQVPISLMLGCVT